MKRRFAALLLVLITMYAILNVAQAKTNSLRAMAFGYIQRQTEYARSQVENRSSLTIATAVTFFPSQR